MKSNYVVPMLVPSVLALWCNTLAATAQPLPAEGPRDLTLVSTRFVTKVTTMTGDVWQVADATKVVGLILTISTTTTGAISCADLVLNYRREGREDRARCQGLGLPAGLSETVWILGDYATLPPRDSAAAPESERRFSALFALEFSVDEVALAWAVPVVTGIGVKPLKAAARR